jgi:formylglycine-generating enzyme required for sulfatase activity
MTTLGVTGNLSRLFYRPLSMETIEIPAGPFVMGSITVVSEDAVDELPQRIVYLDAYMIGKYEVTNRQYIQCINAGVCRPLAALEFLEPEKMEFPVTSVDWEDANAFCRWYGYRLPTEAEWEKAARGEDGRIFPWGDQTPDCNRTTYRECNQGISPVGRYTSNASPYSVLDMAGNVWEWVADWYAADYYENAPDENPPGPDGPEADAYRRVLRGGSALYGEYQLRTANRRPETPDTRNHNIGFRCAKDAYP